MTAKVYQEEAKRTNVDLGSSGNQFHMVLGMVTESAELADAYKKHMAYGRNLDLVNIKEELGDLLWYIANMCSEMGWSMGEVMELNIEKLKARFPDKFDAGRANERDLETERKILEQ